METTVDLYKGSLSMNKFFYCIQVYILTAITSFIFAAPLAAASFRQMTTFGYLPSNLEVHLYIPAIIQDNVPPRLAVLYCTSSGATYNQNTKNNLAVNGDAESGLTNWASTAGNVVMRTTADKHSGSASILITGRTAYWHGITFNVGPLTDGGSYDVSVWVKLATGSPDSEMYLTAKRQDDTDSSTYKEYERVTAAYANSSGWTELQGTYVQSGTPFQHFIVESEDNEAGFYKVSYYVDDFSIVRTVDPGRIPATKASTARSPATCQLQGSNHL